MIQVQVKRCTRFGDHEEHFYGKPSEWAFCEGEDTEPTRCRSIASVVPLRCELPRGHQDKHRALTPPKGFMTWGALLDGGNLIGR